MGGSGGWRNYLRARYRSNCFCLFFRMLRLKRIVRFGLGRGIEDVPSTIRESVPRVNEALRPTAKVESTAKEFPLSPS